jgi:hypothetical protein
VLIPAVAPDPASAAQVAPVAAAQYSKVTWSRVAYPRLGCGTGSTPTATGVRFGVDVLQTSYLEDAKGHRLALVLVRCVGGSPTPSALYAFDGMAKGRPHLRSAMLAPPTAGSGTVWYATRFTTTRNGVTMTAYGVTGSAGLCCPNEAATMSWTWNGSSFQRHVTTRPYSIPTTTTTTVPASVADCTAQQLVVQFDGAQGAAGNWAAGFLIANVGPAPCALRSGVTLELLDGRGASRTASHAVSPPIELSPNASLPPLHQEPAPGETLAGLDFAVPTLPNGILSLGGTGNTCPQPLFQAQSARISFGQQVRVVTKLSTGEPGPTGTFPPICGPDLNIWDIDAFSTP